MMFALLYLLMIIGLPITFGILLFRLRKRLPWGNQNIATTRHYYIFSVEFDKDGKVESTSLKEST